MYKFQVDRRVYKDLDKLPGQDLEKISQSMVNLEIDPRPSGNKKLKGYTNRYRIRQGDYRIIYEIDDEVKTVRVILVKHRKDIYREMN